MNAQDQANEVAEIVKKWVPRGAEGDAQSIQLVRALLHANACVEDQRRVLNGQEPISELDRYPK